MKRLAIGAALTFLVAGVGCSHKTVNDVIADPYRYADRNITLQGRVVESYSVAGHGFYRLEDPTGRLWVFSSRGVPRKGARVQVKGRIHDGFDLSSVGGFLRLPDSVKDRIESGLLMVERSKKARS